MFWIKAMRSKQYLASPFGFFCFLILLAIYPWSAQAQQDLVQLYSNSTSKLPFVEFLGRGGSATGHAFVAVGTELDNGVLFYEGVFGYYPTSIGFSSIKALYRDQGQITFTFSDMSPTIKLRVPVTFEKKEKAIAVLQSWKSNDPGYNLFGNGGQNCTALVRDIAKSIDLVIPDIGVGTVLPTLYIEKLKQANSRN